MIETLIRFLRKDRFTLSDDRALIDALRGYVLGLPDLYASKMDINGDLTVEEMFGKERESKLAYETDKRISYCGLSVKQKEARRLYHRNYQKQRRAKRRLQKEATP